MIRCYVYMYVHGTAYMGDADGGAYAVLTMYVASSHGARGGGAVVVGTILRTTCSCSRTASDAVESADSVVAVAILRRLSCLDF